MTHTRIAIGLIKGETMKLISEFYGYNRHAHLYEEEGLYIIKLFYDNKELKTSTFSSISLAEMVCEDFVNAQ
jgi:hypothetical protein